MHKSPRHRHRGLAESQNFMHASFLNVILAFLYRSWYILFNVKSAFTDISLCSGSDSSAVVGENLLK